MWTGDAGPPSHSVPPHVAAKAAATLGADALRALHDRRLEPREVERCGLSVIAQAVFYRMAMPAFLHRKGWQSYPRGFGAELARHIAEFSLGGMERVAAKRSGRRRRAS